MTPKTRTSTPVSTIVQSIACSRLHNMCALPAVMISATARTLHRLARCAANPINAAQARAIVAKSKLSLTWLRPPPDGG